jgi:hypothetical protein
MWPQITERRGDGREEAVAGGIAYFPDAYRQPWESGARNVSECGEPRTVRHKNRNYGGYHLDNRALGWPGVGYGSGRGPGGGGEAEREAGECGRETVP